MLCLFVELLETFFDFGIFTSSSLLTLKLTVASLCNMLRHLDVSADTAVDFPMEVAIFGAYDKLARVHHPSFARQQSHHPGAPNENMVQNHENIALLNVFWYLNGRYRHIFIP